MSKKQSNSSYASWSLITEGVTSARVEAYRLRHMLNRVMALVEDSEAKDHLYQVGGDFIMGFPQRLHRLEETLDRTSYALSKMGESHLRERLPISDREMVEESLERATPLSPAMRRAANRVAKIASRKEFFDFLKKYYDNIPNAPQQKTAILQFIKFWFLDSLTKVPAKDEAWFTKNNISSEAPPYEFPLKAKEGYGGGSLTISSNVKFRFTPHSIVRSVLRNVSLREAMNTVREHLLSHSKNPAMMDRRSQFFSMFNDKLIAHGKGSIQVWYTISGFQPYAYPRNAVIPKGSVITIHTIIQDGQVERAGSVDLSKWFDPNIIGLDSWDDMDWNTVKDRR